MLSFCFNCSLLQANSMLLNGSLLWCFCGHHVEHLCIAIQHFKQIAALHQLQFCQMKACVMIFQCFDMKSMTFMSCGQCHKSATCSFEVSHPSPRVLNSLVVSIHKSKRTDDDWCEVRSSSIVTHFPKYSSRKRGNISNVKCRLMSFPRNPRMCYGVEVKRAVHVPRIT